MRPVAPGCTSVNVPSLARKCTRPSRCSRSNWAGEPGQSARDAFYVSLALSYSDDGRLMRLGFHIGSEIDGLFDPYRISLAAVLSGEPDACPTSVEELIGVLVGVLPPQGAEE